MQPNWKIAGAAAAAIVATFGLAACSSDSDDTSGSSSSGSGTKIAVVIKGLDNPYFQAMEQGIREQAKADGVTVEIQAAQSTTDSTGQADKLSALANQDYSCYLVNPISGTNLIQGIAQLAAKNKPIVNIDSPVDPDAAKKANAVIATYAGTDNVSAGELAGEQMAKLLPGGGSVAVIGGTAGDVTSGDRVTGFGQGVGDGITIIQTVAANWSRQQALTQAETILRAHPDLSGFFVANDDMALGVSRAVASAGKTGTVKVISIDGIQDALNAIQAGDLSAIVSQYPYVAGAMGVEACQAAAAGKTLPATVPAPVALVTKENVAQALASFPKPFTSYSDPYRSTIDQ